MYKIAVIGKYALTTLRDIHWWTCLKIPGVLRIVTAKMDIRAIDLISELTGVS